MELHFPHLFSRVRSSFQVVFAELIQNLAKQAPSLQTFIQHHAEFVSSNADELHACFIFSLFGKCTGLFYVVEHSLCQAQTSPSLAQGKRGHAPSMPVAGVQLTDRPVRAITSWPLRGGRCILVRSRAITSVTRPMNMQPLFCSSAHQFHRVRNSVYQ
jgi:hypothetical protein